MQSYTLRNAETDDEPFLYQLYALSRQEEMDAGGWVESDRERFLRVQFDALRRHYATHYPGAVWSIIHVGADEAGMVTVIPMEQEIRLGEMILLPSFRGRGICTDIVQHWVAEGIRSGRAVRLHVERGNGAIRLYQRLGFVVIDELPGHFFMEWIRPGQANTAS